MTRRDFEILAEAVSQEWNDRRSMSLQHIKTMAELRYHVASRLADQLQARCSNFNRGKFMQAAKCE